MYGRAASKVARQKASVSAGMSAFFCSSVKKYSMTLTLMIGMVSSPPVVSGPALFEEGSSPEDVVLGGAVAEDRSSSLSHFTVPPGKPVDHVDVEEPVRLAGAMP